MPDIYIATITVGSALALLAGACAAGWTATHAQDIAASWREGCEQLTVWRAALGPVWARALAVVVRAYRLAKWSVCAVRWPARGQHRGRRAGVSA